MPASPDWRPAAWLYGGGFALLFTARWLFRGLLATPAGRLKFSSRLLAVAIYAATIYAFVFAPEIPADIARHFGEYPFGLPVRVLIWAVVTVLYLPLVFGARHIMLLYLAAAELGYHGGIGLVLFFLRSSGFPAIRHSARIAVACAVYGLLLLVAVGCLGARWHGH